MLTVEASDSPICALSPTRYEMGAVIALLVSRVLFGSLQFGNAELLELSNLRSDVLLNPCAMPIKLNAKRETRSQRETEKEVVHAQTPFMYAGK